MSLKDKKTSNEILKRLIAIKLELENRLKKSKENEDKY